MANNVSEDIVFLTGNDGPRTVKKVLEGLLSDRPDTGTVTLTAASTTTVKADDNVTATSKILLMPTTANAAAAKANTYISSRGAGTFTLTHANNAQVDRTFEYVVV